MKNVSRLPVCGSCGSSDRWIFAGHIYMHVKSHIYHKCCCGSPDEIDLDEYRSFYLNEVPKMYPERERDELARFYDKFKCDMRFENWPKEESLRCDHLGCWQTVKIMIDRHVYQTYLYPYGSCKVISYNGGELIVKHYCKDHKGDGDTTFVIVDGFIPPTRKD
jgi:hypothetical protein